MGFRSNNHQNNLIPVNSKLETNLQNVYAIGDIANYPGRIDLIAVGMGEAPMAVNNALESLYPEKFSQNIVLNLLKILKIKKITNYFLFYMVLLIFK